MYYTTPANPASEWGYLATLARGMHVHKFFCFPWDMDAFIETVYVNFHCGVCATLIFCYKIASVT